MSASEDLESLDNKTLRAKCMEYGLPNVPITDTSRKILIKKLRAAMEGGSGAAGSGAKGAKGRRETMFVTSTTSTTTTTNNTTEKEAKPSRSSNRRTTISVVRKENEPAPIAEKRRTSRATPVQETAIPVSVLPSKKTVTVPMLIEESDFDEEFILIDDDVPQQAGVITNIPVIRKSKSPSLVKSVVVTTSYKKDGPKENKIIEEDETEEEGYLEKHKEYNLSKQSYMPHREKDPIASTIPRYTLPANIRISAEKDIYSSGYKPIYPSLNTMDSSTPITKSIYENTSVTKRMFGSSGALPKKPSEEKQSLFRTTINTQFVENSDSNQEDEDDIVKQAPFLSEFAKRLSHLKAEKLDAGLSKDLMLGSPDVGVERQFNRRTYSRKPESRNVGVGESLHQLWVVLDRKYRIKRFIFVVTVLTLIILFIYYYYLQVQ